MSVQAYGKTWEMSRKQKVEEMELEMALDLGAWNEASDSEEDDIPGPGMAFKEPLGDRPTGVVYADGDVIISYLTAESIESAYISAVMNIYNEQKAKELNHYPHPRGELVKSICRALKESRMQEKRDNFVDRGIRSLGDGYKLDELVYMNRIMLEKTDR